MELTVKEMAHLLDAEIFGPGAVDSWNDTVDINTDSRSLQAHQTFWALKGENFDGHDFVQSALSLGCPAAVVNQEWVDEAALQEGALVPVPDTYTSLTKLGKEYSARFTCPKIAITGSNGKTTVKDMIKTVLGERDSVLATMGNFNNHIGVPLTLFRLNRRHQFAVIEMGTNHPGEIAALSETAAPTFCVITSIGHSHREFFPSLDDVLSEKSSIVKGMAQGGTLLINGEDPYLAKLTSTENYLVKTVGLKGGDYFPENLEYDDTGCAHFDYGGIHFQISLPGTHNALNALLAIATACEHGIPLKAIATRLSDFRASSHRMERKSFKGVTYFDDTYNANPSSMLASLKVLSGVKGRGRKIAVLGSMAELGRQSPTLHAEVGRKLAGLNVDYCFTLGSEADLLSEGAESAGLSPDRLKRFSNIAELVRFLVGFLTEGDFVLVKGSRFLKMEQVIEQLTRGDHGL